MTMPDAKTQSAAAWSWWNSLQPRETENGYRHPGDRAALARLRRCATPMEAAMEPATIDLFRLLGFPPTDTNLRRVAALAAVLAHVRESTKETLARALGPPQGGKAEEALLKPLRFKRLMGARGPDEILTGFRRAVQLLGGKAKVNDLATLILVWDQDNCGDRARVRFAFDYYNAGAYAPEADPSIDASKD